jgi:hypothetical protein
MQASRDFDYIVENETGKLVETARRVVEIIAGEKARRSSPGAPGSPKPTTEG